jgi:hypothetical protein
MPQKNMDTDEAMAWAKTALEGAIQEVSDHGLIDSPLLESRLAWAMPFDFVIGQLRDQGNRIEFLWVIGGSVPVDTVHSGVAPTARDAARYFSMKWQLDATRLENPTSRESSGTDHSRVSEAKALVAMAEYLYAIVDDDRYWS